MSRTHFHRWILYDNLHMKAVELGVISIYRYHLISTGMSITKTRQSHDSLLFTMEIPIPGDSLYIETETCFYLDLSNDFQWWMTIYAWERESCFLSLTQWRKYNPTIRQPFRVQHTHERVIHIYNMPLQWCHMNECLGIKWPLNCFFQQLVKANNRKKMEALYHWPFGRIHWDRWIFPQRARNSETVSKSWHYHVGDIITK